MIPTLLESGLILYDYVQLLVALSAVILAFKWKKFEFMGGLFFLFLYSVVEIMDVIFLSVYHNLSFDIAQFGFVLLAIMFFILGMNPSWVPRRPPFMSPSKIEDKTSGDPPIMSLLKKI